MPLNEPGQSAGSDRIEIQLDPIDRERLERLCALLRMSETDVLRHGLAALDREIGDHPAVKIADLDGDPSSWPSRPT